MKTKFSVLLLIAYLSTILSANAQVKLGITGGVNMTKVSLKDVQTNLSASNRTGWFIGPKAEFTLPLLGFGLDVAAEYSQRQYAVEESHKTLRSVEIPINVRYTLGFSSLAAVFLATGPQMSYLIGSDKWNLSQTNFGLEKSTTSWNVGGGVKLLSHFELGVVYNFLINKSGSEANGGGRLRENTFKLQATYLF